MVYGLYDGNRFACDAGQKTEPANEINKGDVTNLFVADSVTTLGDYTFYACSALKEVKIPEKRYEPWNKYIYECQGLTTVTLPESDKISRSVFYHCSALKTNQAAGHLDRTEYGAFGVHRINPDYHFRATPNLCRRRVWGTPSPSHRLVGDAATSGNYGDEWQGLYQNQALEPTR